MNYREFKQRNPSPIAILIIVVVAALAGGIFYWQFQGITSIESPEEI